uniref:(northern house mosquito) hypothetical protein n=1 Tax=Culex pipiens TaxID=7175 RepID=A0A8D8ALU3_CULPI
MCQQVSRIKFFKKMAYEKVLFYSPTGCFLNQKAYLNFPTKHEQHGFQSAQIAGPTTKNFDYLGSSAEQVSDGTCTICPPAWIAFKHRKHSPAAFASDSFVYVTPLVARGRFDGAHFLKNHVVK